MDFQELFGNLSDELDNLVNRLEANVGSNKNNETFKEDVYNLCEATKFNVSFRDIERLKSYKKLVESTDEASIDYVKDTIKKFYKEFSSLNHWKMNCIKQQEKGDKPFFVWWKRDERVLWACSLNQEKKSYTWYI